MLAVLLFHLSEANLFCYLMEINGENGLYIVYTSLMQSTNFTITFSY